MKNKKNIGNVIKFYRRLEEIVDMYGDQVLEMIKSYSLPEHHVLRENLDLFLL